MSRLSLVIADIDETYLESIVNFIMNYHSKKFQVSYYTDKSKLDEYLSLNNKIDILLISSKIYTKDLNTQNIKTTIFFFDPNNLPDIKDYKSINKYQQGDKIVDDILEIYQKENEISLFTPKGKKLSKVIGIYSPVGGCGKTTLAVSTSIYFSHINHSTFYLNLENISSTLKYFKEEANKSMSDVFYYIKENNKNFSFKMESQICVDEISGVNYFCPSQSICEINEMDPSEIKYLIEKLKESGHYDFIFVDLSSDLNLNNITVMDNCDEIIFVLSEDLTSIIKGNIFLNSANLLNRKFKNLNTNIIEKLIIVFNKYTGNSSLVNELEVNLSNITIPLINGLDNPGALLYLINNNSFFKNSLDLIYSKIILK